MTDKELKEAADGLFAYDTGCTDSGIKDDHLKQKVIQLFRDDEKKTGGRKKAWIARELFLTDEAIDEGYGLQDAVEFAHWLDGLMQ